MREHFLMCSKADVRNPTVSEIDLVAIGIEQCEFDGDKFAYRRDLTLPHKVTYNQARQSGPPTEDHTEGGYYACAVSSLKDTKKSFAETLEASYRRIGYSKLFCNSAGGVVWAAKISYQNYFGVPQTRYFKTQYDAMKVYKNTESDFSEISEDEYLRLTAQATDVFGQINFDKNTGFSVDQFEAAMRFRMKNPMHLLLVGKSGVELLGSPEPGQSKRSTK